MANGGFMSEECIMEIFSKQCIPILMYGAGVWIINSEEKRKVCVCMNRGVRRIFMYNDFESVKDILFGFNMLPADLYIIRASLLCGCALRSRSVLVQFPIWQRDRYNVMQHIMNLGINYSLDKMSINTNVWKSFTLRVDWA